MKGPYEFTSVCRMNDWEIFDVKPLAGPPNMFVPVRIGVGTLKGHSLYRVIVRQPILDDIMSVNGRHHVDRKWAGTRHWSVYLNRDEGKVTGLWIQNELEPPAKPWGQRMEDAWAIQPWIPLPCGRSLESDRVSTWAIGLMEELDAHLVPPPAPEKDPLICTCETLIGGCTCGAFAHEQRLKGKG